MIVKNVERIAISLRISSFAISFLILGFFTSVSELSVGLSAVVKNDPEIYVGNLIGASIVLFMLVIPLLAIVGKNIHIQKGFAGYSLPLSLLVIGSPVIFAMDGIIERRDGIICMLLYILLAGVIQTKQGVIERLKNMAHFKKLDFGKKIAVILTGVVIIFLASRLIVDQTEYFAQLLGVTPFLISLLVIAVGTNMPEIALAFKSIMTGNRQVAFGDYVGSAAFNTFIFGFLSTLTGAEVYLTNSYLVSLVFLLIGLTLFFVFARSKSTISRTEGLIILLVYLGFLFSEYYLHINEIQLSLAGIIPAI